MAQVIARHSQVERVLTFGLGMADRIESVEIVWPDGSRQPVDSVQVDSVLTVEQAPLEGEG